MKRVSRNSQAVKSYPTEDNEFAKHSRLTKFRKLFNEGGNYQEIISMLENVNDFYDSFNTVFRNMSNSIIEKLKYFIEALTTKEIPAEVLVTTFKEYQFMTFNFSASNLNWVQRMVSENNLRAAKEFMKLHDFLILPNIVEPVLQKLSTNLAIGKLTTEEVSDFIDFLVSKSVPLFQVQEIPYNLKQFIPDLNLTELSQIIKNPYYSENFILFPLSETTLKYYPSLKSLIKNPEWSSTIVSLHDSIKHSLTSSNININNVVSIITSTTENFYTQLITSQSKKQDIQGLVL